MNRWMDDDVRQRRNTGFLPAGAGTRRDGKRPIQAQDAMGGSRMELGPDPAGMAAGPDAGAPMRPPMAGADGGDRALASREIMMGARSGAGPLKGREIDSQKRWDRHIRAQIAAEHPPEHAPVAGAYARQMEAGRPGLVPVRDREKYNAWSAQRAAADQRAERSGFRREQAQTDLELRRADVDARRMGNELTARKMMGEEEPWRPEVVDMGEGRTAMTTSPRSAVPWKDAQDQPPPWEPEVKELDGGRVRVLMEGPERARVLSGEDEPFRPELVEMDGKGTAMMTSPRSAVPFRPEAGVDPDWVPPTRHDEETGMTMYQPAPGAPWRHAARDPYADRAMSAEQRSRLVTDHAYATREIQRKRNELKNAGRWSRGRIKTEIDDLQDDLDGYEAALSGRSGGRGREMMEDGPEAGAERGLDASEAMMGAEPGGGDVVHERRAAEPVAGQAKASGDAVPDGYVMMEAPDGSREIVTESMADAYRQRGAKVIDPDKVAEHRAAMESLITDLQGRRN